MLTRGRIVDAAVPLIIAVVAVLVFWFASAKFQQSSAEAVALVSIAMFVLAIVAFIVLGESHVSDELMALCIYTILMAMLAGIGLAIWRAAPPLVFVASAIALAVFAFFADRKEFDVRGYAWIPRKALLALALLAGFTVWQYMHHWLFAVTMVVIVLMVQFFWTIHLWVRPARVPV